MRFYIFENDLRQEMIAKHLEKKCCDKISKEDIDKADFIMLPFVTRGTMEDIDDEFVLKLKKDCVVFTGAKNEVLKKQFEQHGIKFVEIIRSKNIAILNAIPTAEGVIYNALEDLNRTIFGAKTLIIGYGICGSEIAKKLKSLGGEIETLEIDETKNVLAKTRGIQPVDRAEIDNREYDLIINTVDEHVFKEDEIKNFNKETVIFDIASPPFGFDEIAMKNLDLKYRRLRGLPSEFGLQFSGEIMSEYIINELRGE